MPEGWYEAAFGPVRKVAVTFEGGVTRAHEPSAFGDTSLRSMM